MKFAVVGLGLLLFPYAALVPSSDGNPNGTAYAGQPGSTYDAAANPAQPAAAIAYNPLAPLPVNNSSIPAGAPNATPATAP